MISTARAWKGYRNLYGIGTLAFGTLVGCSQPQAGENDAIGRISSTATPEAPVSSGWPAGEAPKLAEGLRANLFASGLDQPTSIYVLPNGDVLVAESESAEGPAQSTGLLEWIGRKWRGTSQPKPIRKHRITLLRDADDDGIADVRTVFLDDIDATGGMALVGTDLYLATGDKVLRFDYLLGATKIVKLSGRQISPVGSTDVKYRYRSLVSRRDGTKLYATTSPSSTGSDDMVGETEHGTILEIDRATGRIRDLASELRSPNGLAMGPAGDLLWTAIEERLGDDVENHAPNSLKPLDSIQWKRCVYCRYAPPDDRRIAPTSQRPRSKIGEPDLERVEPPVSGLAVSQGTGHSAQFAAGMFVDRHPSTETHPDARSDIVFIPFLDGIPSGDPIVVMTGFVDSRGTRRGRPAGMAIDARGSLLAADDLAGVVWRITDTAPDDHLPETPGKSLRARKHDKGDRI